MQEFDFDGGNLTLDFANTAEWHASQQPVERLNSYTDLLEWSQQAGILDAALMHSLKARSQAEPKAAQQVYELGLALREVIYRIFSAIAAGETPASWHSLLISVAVAA